MPVDTVAWTLVGIEASPQKAVERAAAARPPSARSFARITRSPRVLLPARSHLTGDPLMIPRARFINDADLDPNLGDGGDPYEAISPR